jgi:HD-like signal output (HDOD) protein
MARRLSPTTAELLTRFDRMDCLAPKQLTRLALHTRIENVPPGSRLLDLGSTDESTLYLLDGEVEVLASDGARRFLHAAEPAARRPLSRLRPSRYRVTARSDVRYLKIANDILEDILMFEESSQLLLEEISAPAEADFHLGGGNAVMALIHQQIHQGRLVVPSLFAVAENVGRAVLNAGTDTRRLLAALMLDPALAAKTVATVNTALVADEQPVESCRQAVERLGPQRATDLVINWVLRDSLRQPSAATTQRMQAWWQRSVRVSAIARDLAHLSERFDPDIAAFAGLVHRIGEPIILYYAEKLPTPLDRDELDRIVAGHANEVGRRALELWKLSDALIGVVNEAGNLLRDHALAADYSDIVVVAERHADIGRKRPVDAPPPNEMPAFARLGLGEMSPEFSLRMVAAANGALAQAGSMLVA